MRDAIVFDCEFLTNESAPSRFWCGPADPDPTVVQIGAVRLGLEGDAPLSDEFMAYVTPRDRTGGRVVVDPHLTWLTGISDATLAERGMPLSDALARFTAFADGAPCVSWGKDELNLMAISCYIEGSAPPMPPGRFRNAAALLLAAGLPPDTVARARSNTLADVLGLEVPAQRAHDALGDARIVAHVLRHLLRDGRLVADDFERARSPASPGS